MIIRRIVLILSLFLLTPTFAHAEIPFKAAFVRDHQLWLKQGENETQLTKGQYVYSPKWSYDGRLIAYIDGGDKGGKSQLYIYDTKEKESYKPYTSVETTNFKWSPQANVLAYTSGGVLNVTKSKDGRPEGFENVALGVDDFDWFPDGKYFLVSSQASLKPAGWGPIDLYKVSVDANLSPEKINPFYTIETKEPELFAISAEDFKWSADGKWIGFLAIPTASWSNDSNTLCVLSSNGDDFQVIGKMLWFQDWFQWAPFENQLVYISGEGRFMVENKKTTIADIPAATKQKEYTPAGFVDLDVEWYSPDTVVVARAKENKEWEEGPVPTMYTSLHSINLISSQQTQLTFPNQEELDLDPQAVDTFLTWYRTKKDAFQGDIWMKDGLKGKERMWLKSVDSAPALYNY
jgi:dipeptidyl aminopeptidase/acylaminoacyl peptidase